ncbi:MAG: F0F1 ATP synthase subunit B [Chromatiales bacterium]|nr:F0F1 ATP synthase subunit B [Chromatiales bacterium]
MNINATLIGQAISFAIFVWFCMKFVWPPIMAALEERKTKIADGLAAAERGKHEQELAEQRAKEVIKEAKEEAAGILAQANKRASEIVEEAKETARTEGDRIVAAANAEIEQEVNRAKESLRGQVVSLAVAGAGKVIDKELDASAHDALLQDLVSQI